MHTRKEIHSYFIHKGARLNYLICPFLLKEPIISTVIFWRYQSEQMHFNTLNNPQWSARRILSDEVRGHTQMCLPLPCVPSLGGGRLYYLRPNPGNGPGSSGDRHSTGMQVQLSFCAHCGKFGKNMWGKEIDSYKVSI